MTICSHCSEETNNPKFCNSSCAATYNNRCYPKRTPEGSCNICSAPIPKGRGSYCKNCVESGKKRDYLLQQKPKKEKPDTFKTSLLKHSEDYLRGVFNSCASFSEVFKSLGLKATGGNYKTLHRYITRYEIDCSHMTGQAWNRDKTIKSFEGLTSNVAIKKRLVSSRDYRCQKCLLSEWLGIPICLELEHIDGNHNNNSQENLLLLCPNCHAQTPTWRNRKR